MAEPRDGAAVDRLRGRLVPGLHEPRGMGAILKSFDGIPPPAPPPRDLDMAKEARTARSRFYPVTVAYTAYALVVLALGVRAGPRTAFFSMLAAVSGWTLVEYLVHRYVLHGRFPDGPGRLRHGLHVLFDGSHGDHHQRPWDGRHVNGGFATVPFALILALAGFLAPLPTLPVFVATILQCYVLEEWLHYAAHFHRLPGRYFSYIRKRHVYHHTGRGAEVAFGLSNGIWDVPLRTRIPWNDRRLLYRRPRPGTPRSGPCFGSRLLMAALALALPGSAARAEENVARAFLRKVVGFTDAQIAAVEAGQVVTKQLPAADKPESAAFGAVRLSGGPAALLRRFRRDAGVARSGSSILEVGRFSGSPRVEDLAGLTLEEGDFAAARECEPGDCHIKLSRSAIERMRREIDWKAADARARASALMKQMLVEYTAAYMQGGTAEMATYANKDRPLDTPAEFRRLLAASPYLVEYVPALHRYLEEFPKGSLAGAEDLFYWQKDKFAPKPTVSIFHVTLWTDPGGDAAVIASKRIYSSHYFQAGLDLLAVVAAPGGGCYLMDLYRARIDPPGGILAGAILGKIRGGIEHGVADRLRAQAALPAP